MARGPRLDCTGSLHHVYSRAAEGRQVFDDPREAEGFFDRLASVIPRSGSHIYAWALMPNHFHLLIETGQEPLSVTMQSLLSGFSMTYNRRNAHKGHVFMSRFHSILVDGQVYFERLLRYIHLNPVRAGLVCSIEDLAHYPYAGHAAMLGGERRTWHDVDVGLSHLAGSLEAAQTAYRDLVRKTDTAVELGDCLKGNLFMGKDGVITDSPSEDPRRYDFAGGILASPEFARELCTAMRGRRRGVRRRGMTHRLAEEILADVLGRHGLTELQLRSGTRTGLISRARQEVSQALRQQGFTLSDIGRLLNITPQAVSYLLRSRVEDTFR